MADPNEKWADVNPLVAGTEAEPGATPVPARSWPAAVGDTALNLGAGLVGVGRQVAGAVEGAASAIDTDAPVTKQIRRVGDSLADVETSIKGYRSEQEQDAERRGGYSFGTDPGKYLMGAGIGMLPYAPLAMMGVAGPPVALALGFGQVRSDERENIRQAPIEEMRKNPQYIDLRDQGLSDVEARERLAVESTDPRKLETWKNAAPNMIGQAATSGFGHVLVKGLSYPAMRSIKTGIAERILETVNKSWIRGRATGAALGGASGAALGGGTELSRQLSAQTSGMQQTPTDWDKVGEAMGETSALFTPLGVLGYRRPARFTGAKAPPIGIDVEAAAMEAEGYGKPGASVTPATGGAESMTHGDLGLTPPPPEGEYGPARMAPSTAYMPPGPEMRPTDIGMDYPGTGKSDLATLRRQTREFGPATSEVGPRPPVEPGPPMHEGDLAPRDEFGGELGYPEPFPATVPRKGAEHRTMTGEDLGEYRPPEYGYPGLEEASPRTTAPTPPKRGTRTFGQADVPVHKPGEPEGPPDLRPKPTLEEPKGGPEFPEIEAPGLPETGDFPHEGGGAPSWRGGPAQRRIAEHLAGANEATRGQIAALLKAGARTVADLPAAVQRTLGKVRDVVDRALEFDRNGTIETIRGGAIEVGAPKRLDADEKAAVEALRDRMDADTFTKGSTRIWGDRIAAAAGSTHGKIAMGVLPKSLNEALNALPEGERAQVKSALRTNAREVADTLRGKDYVPVPGEWIHEDKVREHKKETKAAAKAEKAERDVLTAEPEHGPREAVEADVAPVAGPPPKPAREMVTRDIYPAPGKLGEGQLKSDKGLRGEQVLRRVNQKIAARQAKMGRVGTTGRLVSQKAAYSEQYSGARVVGRQIDRPGTLVTERWKPPGEAKPAAPPPAAPTRPPRVLPVLPQTPAMRALIRKRQLELLAQAERAEEAAKHASGPASKAAFQHAADEARRRANELLAERTTQVDLERRAKYEKEDAKVTAEGERLWEQLYGKMKDMLKRARLKYEKENKDPKVQLRENDAQRKAEERKPTYTMKDLIAGETLKVEDPKAREAEVKALHEIVTGKAEGTTETVQAGERKGRQKTTAYRKVTETSALLPDPVNFITATRDGLIRIAKALVERAREKIADAEKGFVNDHEARLARGEPGWNIPLTVGRNRGPHGIYYNHLVQYKRFIRAVNEFKGSPDMLRTMILNHYMGERLVMEGKAHKLDELHKEQINFLRDLAVERYNSVKADGTAGEIRLAQKAFDAFNKELDDALYTEALDETHHSVVHDTELFELLEHEGIKPGAVDKWGSVRLAQFVEQHNEDLLKHLQIDERRKIEGKREIQPHDRQMAEIYGEKWFDADDPARMDMINEQSMLEELGGRKGEAVREPPLPPATGPRTFDIDGRPEAGMHREAVVGDIQQGLREQLAYLNDGKPLGPTGRAYRIQKLMDRAQHLYDQMETIPEKARDKKLQDELRLIEDEIRQHYEDANPKARNVEYGIGQVLENASDLSKPDNLPKGAYVRRVSDFLKEGSRDIRKSVGGLMYSLRQHLLKVADAAVGNMEIVALKPEQMRLAAEARGLPGETPAFYDRKTHRIIVSQEVLNSPNRAKILGHEITHPLTLRAMEMFPAVRRKIEGHLQDLRDAYRDLRNPKYDELRRVMDEDPQVMNNVHEFLAQLYNDGGKTAWMLQQIDVPPLTKAKEIWARGGLWNALRAVHVTIRGGLNDLLFKISKNKLLNDTLLNSLDLFHRLDDAGEFKRPSARGEAMPYTPKEPMGKREQELWSSYRARNIDHVLSRGENFTKYEQRASSYAIAEDGTIHDVGLHEYHVGRMAEARGLDPDRAMSLTGESYFNEEGKTFRPWVHISKFYDADGASLGINRSSEMTPAQAAVVRQLAAGVNKAQRAGERIELDGVDNFRNQSGMRFDLENQKALGRKIDQNKRDALKRANISKSLEKGPTADYVMRGDTAVSDYLKYLDQHAHEWPEYKLLADSLRAFQHLLGDTKIRVVDTKDFRKWSGSVGMAKSVRGVFMDSRRPYVAVPKNYRMTTVVHELAHAATVRALQEHPEFAHAIARIAVKVQDTKEYWKWREENGYGPTDGVYAFHDPGEFIAEFYSKVEFRDLLSRINLTRAEVKALTGGFAKKNLFQIVTDMIAKWLRNPFNRKMTAEHLTGAMLRDILERQAHLRDYDALTFAGVGESRHSISIMFDRDADSIAGARFEAVRPRTAEGAVRASSELWKDAAFRLKRMGISGGIIKASTFVDLRRRAEQGMQDVVRGVEDHYSKIETLGKNLFKTHGAEDISHAIAEEMRMPPGVFQKLQDYVSKENHYRVSGGEPLYTGKNAWVSKDSPYHKHYRDRHAELAREYAGLTPSQKELRRRILDFNDKQHGRLLDQNLRTVIGLREMVPGDDKPTTDALMKHVMREALTDADKTKLEKIGWRADGDTAGLTATEAKFKQNVSELRASPLFKKVAGVWYPSERRGQWVVHGRYDLSDAARKHGGRRIDDNGHEWEFDTDAQAQAFYNEVTSDPRYGGIHHEGTTQHVYEADASGKPVLDAEGKPIPMTEYSERTVRKGEPGEPGFSETTTGAKRRISARTAAGEPGTVTRHRVEFNPLLIEFYEKEREAYERHEELRGDAALRLTDMSPVRDTKGTYLDPKKASRTMGVLMDGLERGDAWRNMSDGQRAMARRDLHEAAARHIMSVSARSRIPKRYALGADKSLLRDFTTYARNTSMTLAEGQMRPGLSKALRDMDDYVKRNEHSTGGGDGASEYGTLRKKLQAEVYERVFSRPSDIVAPFWSNLLARALQISYMDKLMSPGFVVLNASEPWVLGAPLLAGHHGFKAYGEIGKAYSTLGFGGMWMQGLKDAYKAGREGTMARFDDTHMLMRDRVKGEKDGARLQQLMDYGGERGYLDRDAGMELAQRLDPSTSRGGQGLDYLDNISRQINQQVENVNRGVMAIASYRLMFDKLGGNKEGASAATIAAAHEKAMQHAFDIVHDTSGNYGHWNTPAMFNDPRFKFALQFKRYSQRITANYMRMFAGAFARLPSEQRSIARKQLGIMMGSQVLLAGSLGLPTEPLKAALLATSPITGFGPDEAEVWAREAAASVIGNSQLAEAVMRGFPRAYIDIGIGTRIGHDSLWSHGTLGKKPDNWFATVGHYVGGAPASLLVDLAMAAGKTVDSVGHFAKGNTTQAMADGLEALQLGMPIKLASDTLGAAQNYLGGPMTMTPAGQPLGYEPNWRQAAMEAAGIRSGTQQEASDKRFALTQAKAEYASFKTKAMQMYVRASTPAEQRSIKDAAIARSRERYPTEMQLNASDFYKAQRRFDLRQSADPGDVGVMISKKQAGLRDRFDFFNT